MFFDMICRRDVMKSVDDVMRCDRKGWDGMRCEEMW